LPAACSADLSFPFFALSTSPSSSSSYPPKLENFQKQKQEEEFCDEFHLVDLRVYDNCKKVVAGCDQVFNLAADMGGMG